MAKSDYEAEMKKYHRRQKQKGYTFVFFLFLVAAFFIRQGMNGMVAGSSNEADYRPASYYAPNANNYQMKGSDGTTKYLAPSSAKEPSKP
jgi:hypothetical protein